MSNEKIKRIPYGLANYEQLVRQNCYYVDKTMYIEMLENAGNYLFFIRPRRFGKSLFISIMEAYYDVYYKDRFEELFRGTAIYKQPTEEKGSYLVLTFNFSVVDPTPANVEISFLNYVRGEAISFIRKYDNHLIADKESSIQTIEQSQSSADILSALVRLCKDSHQKIYVFVDEYDNFANTILSTAGEHAYKDLTHGEGFFRSFFNVLKSGTTGMGAPISRLFITGVSPITMDDVTSGFNIGKNVSLLPHFNPMLGFTENEVEQMIAYYREKGLLKQETTGPAAIIKEWYGNYLFSEEADLRLFNSDMVLYFIDNYLTGGKIPQDLIDRNVRIDYGKLRHLILVDQSKGQGRTTNGNFQRLKEIVENGGISSKLEKAFPLEQLKSPKNFTSLLFYFGLLTIQGIERDKLRFIIPNETVKRLYYDYITEAYRETNVFDLDISLYSDLMSDMAYEGKWQPLFDFIASRMKESMNLRDLITGEKAIQAFLHVYLGLSNLYIIHAEKELNKGYADMAMEPFTARYEGIKYSYLLEIKYIKAGLKYDETVIQKLKTEAGNQLQNYSMDAGFQKSIKKTTLKKIVLIFSGCELLYIGEA